MTKTKEDALEYAKTKKANEKYNQQMAEEKHQNTLRELMNT